MADLESDRIERTRSTKDTTKFREVICAFSNDFPEHRLNGFLLIGVDDRTGSGIGLQATDQLLKDLAGLRQDGEILPTPAMEVYKISLSDGSGDVVIAEVHPTDLPPVRYRGRVYIRVGPRKAVASETEERILSERRVASAKTFDARTCTGTYRNPVVAESMKILGYVNRFGRGVYRAQDALATNGNPSAEFEFQPTFTGVIIRKQEAL